MFIASLSAPVKLKVCRAFPRMKFYLEVQGGLSPVTLWLPSDFTGRIHLACSSAHKPTFSPGFVNSILPHVRINAEEVCAYDGEDEVVVRTTGKVTLKMWDIAAGAPERKSRERWRRLLGCSSMKTPEATIDWDFLLDD